MRASALLLLVGLVCGGSACGTDCEKLRQQAADLENEYAACSASDRCVVVDLYDVVGSDNCLVAFQCSAALREGADMDAFSRRARAIADEFRSGCSECSTASCPAPTQTAQCNASSGRCEIVE